VAHFDGSSTSFVLFFQKDSHFAKTGRGRLSQASLPSHFYSLAGNHRAPANSADTQPFIPTQTRR